MSEELTIVLNSEQAKAELNSVSNEADKVERDVSKKMEMAQIKSDQAWLKAVSIVQRTEAVLMQALRFAGVTVDAITSAVISTVNQAVSVLIPLFTAQTLSGWQTASAVLGLISLGIATANVAKMASEEYGGTNILAITMGLNFNSNGIGL